MVTIGDIFRRYVPAYRAQFGDQLSAEQIQAMRATLQCRTEALGGQVYTCPSCATTRYSYHSCRNRHCPTCQHAALFRAKLRAALRQTALWSEIPAAAWQGGAPSWASQQSITLAAGLRAQSKIVEEHFKSY